MEYDECAKKERKESCWRSPKEMTVADVVILIVSIALYVAQWYIQNVAPKTKKFRHLQVAIQIVMLFLITAKCTFLRGKTKEENKFIDKDEENRNLTMGLLEKK
ncbi:hypothetical protein U1Q18_052419 [Sarracenia purpurea var. burkii]